jgi:hypothetical protein
MKTNNVLSIPKKRRFGAAGNFLDRCLAEVLSSTVVNHV